MTAIEFHSCFDSVYAGKQVLVTGHTGFKGAWLCEWLTQLGAHVTGFSLPPPTEPSLFAQLGLAARLQHVVGDVRDGAAVRAAVARTRPDFVFHLAAQPLVRLSYREPLETYATNVMGTAHVLDAVRLANYPTVVIVVTTDKCYENREWVHSYREEDALGGHDPYSSSKAAAELVVAAYRRSFFGPDSGVRVATVRAGNVIGGGDWAEDRIVPDCIRALSRQETIVVRNRVATRPWQHVLDPLSGYLWLAATLATSRADVASRLYASAFNFGPAPEANRNVAELVREILRHWPGQSEDRSDPTEPHEAQRLNLATDKARHLLNWRSTWAFDEAIARTVAWYQAVLSSPEAAPGMTRSQLSAYVAESTEVGAQWACGISGQQVVTVEQAVRNAA